MHLLRSDTIGTEVIDDLDHHVHGIVMGLLIDPDRGKVIALFVGVPGASELFALQTQDIAAWGNRIHIREAELMGPVSDFIRLQEFLSDDRTVIGQQIRTKDGVKLGKCTDVQFETETFMVEWIFPRKFFRKGLAMPISDVLEIKSEAIIVKNQGPKGEEVTDEEPKMAINVETLPKATIRAPDQAIIDQ